MKKEFSIKCHSNTQANENSNLTSKQSPNFELLKSFSQISFAVDFTSSEQIGSLASSAYVSLSHIESDTCQASTNVDVVYLKKKSNIID